MIRAILTFVVLWASVFGLIEGFKLLTNQERLETCKSLLYSLVTAIIAFGLIVLFVVVF